MPTPLTTNILNLPVAVSLDGSEWVPLVQGTDPDDVTRRATTGDIGDLAFRRLFPAAIEFLIDGGGGNITAQTWGYLTVPFNATVSGARLFGNGVGSIIVDVWKCTYAQFDAGSTHPVAGDSICGGFPPTIVTSTKGTVSGIQLASWSTQLLQDDVLAFNVPSLASGITRVTLALDLTRNSAT